MTYSLWIYGVVTLILTEAWGEDPGSNQSTIVIPSTSPDVVRNESFNQGKDVNLTCSEKTWNETIYIIWDITLKDKPCKVSLSGTGLSLDTCKDGKSLRNTSSSQSYLHIPNFSSNDVGIYKCQLSYKGGLVNVVINVATTVPPVVSVWFERVYNKTVVICKAEKGTPAANISWNVPGNSSVKPVLTDHGLITVESHLLLPEGTDPENISCIVRHPCWEREQLFWVNPRKVTVPWLLVLIVVIITVLVAGFLFIAQKKLRILRQRQQCDDSSSKSPPIEDVEEVEPYASYVQRVNSIYNSSADLFT